MPELKEPEKVTKEFYKWVHNTSANGYSNFDGLTIMRSTLVLAMHNINMIGKCCIAANAVNIVYHSMDINKPDKIFTFSDYKNPLGAYIDYQALLDCMQYIYREIYE